MTADFDPNSLNKVEREKRARLYKPDEAKNTTQLAKVLEDIIEDITEGNIDMPLFEQKPPVLKGYKVLPKYSKFLVRVCTLF